MKKIISIVLILALCLSLAACGSATVETETDKEYTLDKDTLEEILFSTSVEGDRNAFNSVYAVTDETYDALVGSIVSKNLINDYIVFLPETDWTNYILFAFQTDNVDAVTSAMTEYFDGFKADKWLSDDQVGVYVENGWYVWSVSLANDDVLDILKAGMEKDALQAELLALKEALLVFAGNMPSTLDDEFYTLEGMLDKENLVEMYILNSTIIGVNPLMIFKPAEGCDDAIKEFMTTWQANQLDTMSWYQPNLVPIIESMELIEENGYLIYIISDYNDDIKAAIADSWMEVA
ncbi:MAG: hypothetical protein R3Y65_04360 [Bacillota bacterium]